MLNKNLFKELRFFLSLLKPYPLQVRLFIVGSLFVALFDGISIGLLIPALGFLQGDSALIELPSVLQWLSELVMFFPAEKQLIYSLAFVVLSVLIKNVLLALTLKQGLWLSNRVTADARSKAVEILLTVGLSFHHKSKVGELLEQTINHTYQIRELIVYLIQFFVFVLMFIVLVVVLVTLSWSLTIIAIGLGVVSVLLLSFYMKNLPYRAELCAKTSRELTGAVQENLSAVQLIQTYSQEKNQLKKLNTKIDANFLAENKLATHGFYIQPLTEGLGVLAIGLLLTIAFVFFPTNSSLQLAILIPYLYVLIRIVNTHKMLNDSWRVVLSCWPFLRLVHDLVRKDNKSFVLDGKEDFNHLSNKIVFENVTYSYDGSDQSAINKADFTLIKGEKTAFVGKSGAGKSTIVNLLLRFSDPQQGRIYIDEQPLCDLTVSSYRKTIGVVSQDTFIFHDTVKNNIAFSAGNTIDRDEVIDAAKKANAHEFILTLPNGYETILGDRGINLSGGQRQRISIARAILKNPEILILDEATSALDTVTEKLIHDAIDELSHDRTVIIIAHRLSTIKNADKVIVLKNGSVTESGTPEELIALGKEFYSLVNIEI